MYLVLSSQWIDLATQILNLYHTISSRSLANPSLANKTPTFVPPSSEELSNPMLVGIDAEFVALTAEETELVSPYLLKTHQNLDAQDLSISQSLPSFFIHSMPLLTLR